MRTVEAKIDLALAILWIIAGGITLAGDHISKICYGCTWIILVINYLISAFKSEAINNDN